MGNVIYSYKKQTISSNVDRDSHESVNNKSANNCVNNGEVNKSNCLNYNQTKEDYDSQFMEPTFKVYPVDKKGRM